MKKDNPQYLSARDIEKEDPGNSSAKSSALSRRKFVQLTATTAAGFTILPRHVLGGKNFISPSDKVTLAYIGVGTQGTRELLELLPQMGIQVIAVCDPNKNAVGYRDWGINYLKDNIRKTINDPNWNPGGDNTIPGGRDNAKSIVDTYYANLHPELKYKGCKTYADARELLDKEKDLDAVKIMTPDHLHGILSIAAMKKGKHVLVHKPISNRLAESKKVIGLSRNSKVITHLIPWDSNGSMENVMAWIHGGAIGTLKEVHNWTNRPVWPQYSHLPTDTPAVPDGFDWDLWLGPEATRAYSPDYTNMVFRGWYDFGGGSMADMGHYSLWTVFNALNLTSPLSVEPHRSHVCDFHGPVPYRIDNDFAFPMACTVRFKYPANGNRPPVDLIWYDGGMRPPIPDELVAQNKQLPEEGMMFVGDNGKILAGFNVQNPQIISGKKMDPVMTPDQEKQQMEQKHAQALPLFIEACKTGKQYPGNFSEAEHLTDAINLYAVALRSNKLLEYDADNLKITNVPDANKYLSREYRQGWDPETI
jgi:hypothetical protein